MRSRGITGFPDPTFPGGRLNLQIPSSIDTTSRQFTQAAQTCTRLIPAGLPAQQRVRWLMTMGAWRRTTMPGSTAGGGS